MCLLHIIIFISTAVTLLERTDKSSLDHLLLNFLWLMGYDLGSIFNCLIEQYHASLYYGIPNDMFGTKRDDFKEWKSDVNLISDIVGPSSSHKKQQRKTQAMKPLGRRLQLLEGMLGQASAATLVMASTLTPALQMLASDRRCFIPYLDRDPQYVSKARTCRQRGQKWGAKMRHDLIM